MRVFVSGGSGFVGVAVVERLVRGGHDVVGATNSPEGAAVLEALGAHALVLDVDEPPPAWLAALTRAAPDVVVHLAISHAAPARNAARMRRMVVEGTRRVVDACEAVRERWGFPRRFVHGGSAVVGEANGALLTEATPLVATTPRGHALNDAEAIALSAASRGQEVIALRPSRVYGAGGWFARLVAAVQQGRFVMPGLGDNLWDLVHVDDVADAFARAVELDAPRSRGRVFHVVDDTPLTLATFVEAIARGLGAVPPHRRALWLARLLAGRAATDEVVRSARSANARVRAELAWAPAWPDSRRALPSLLATLALSPP